VASLRRDAFGLRCGKVLESASTESVQLTTVDQLARLFDVKTGEACL
jgi:hypothetical protein